MKALQRCVPSSFCKYLLLCVDAAVFSVICQSALISGQLPGETCHRGTDNYVHDPTKTTKLSGSRRDTVHSVLQVLALLEGPKKKRCAKSLIASRCSSFPDINTPHFCLDCREWRRFRQVASKQNRGLQRASESWTSIQQHCVSSRISCLFVLFCNVAVEVWTRSHRNKKAKEALEPVKRGVSCLFSVVK